MAAKLAAVKRLVPQTATDRLLRPLPRLRGRDREGACKKMEACALTPSPPLPRKRGREQTEQAARERTEIAALICSNITRPP
jgi:hypothetical protein